MAIISLRSKGFGADNIVVLRNGKATCRSCPCIPFSNPGLYNVPDWWFSNNTFTITKDEYYNFLYGKPLRAVVDISHVEEFKDYQGFPPNVGELLYEGKLNFRVSSDSVMEKLGNKACCSRFYFLGIPIEEGNMYLYYIFENENTGEPSGVNLDVTGLILLELTVTINESDGEYKANYVFQLGFSYNATATIDGVEYQWAEPSSEASGNGLYYTASELWRPGNSIFVNTGFPNNMTMKINGTQIETPSTYRGPQAYRQGYLERGSYWSNIGDEYNNLSSINIGISHDV